MKRNNSIPVELPVIRAKRVELYRKELNPFYGDFQLGFWVTDGERYQLFCVNIYAPRTFESEVLNRCSIRNGEWYRAFNRIICHKTKELLFMFERWEQKSEYLTELWTLPTGGYDVRHYPKPKRWWTVAKVPALHV